MPQKETSKSVVNLIREEAWDAVATALTDLHPADIADIIDRAPAEAHLKVFSLIAEDLKPDVLAELESGAESGVLEALSASEISDIVEEMAPDDAADILGEMPSHRSEEVLDLMEEKDSEEVRRLLEYDEDTAGGIMTPDVVSMQKDATVAEALEAIAYFEDGEPFFYAYIVDKDQHLTGYVDIWELLREKRRDRPLYELSHADHVAVNVNMDQEDVARQMSQYDLTAIAVVDDEGRLVGRVTSDDVLDVLEEEASEDIFLLAGSDNVELQKGSLLRSCMARLPWLFITLFGGFATSLILEQFHAHISHFLILAAFVPIILAMGGNTGIQSSTLIVRSIALGGLEGRSIIKLLTREIFIGALMGAICGTVIGIWASFIGNQSSVAGILPPRLLSLIVATSLFSAMTFAAMFGALVPVVLNRFNVDPAVAAGPFVTITNDISALLIYFGVTILLINKLTTVL